MNDQRKYDIIAEENFLQKNQWTNVDQALHVVRA
jgi:hypothetical protein